MEFETICYRPHNTLEREYTWSEGEMISDSVLVNDMEVYMSNNTTIPVYIGKIAAQ